MRLSNLKTRLSSFWTLQIIGWSLYGVMIYITFLTVVDVSRMFSLLQVKFIRAVVGFLLTSGIRYIYKHLAAGRSFRFIALLVFTCSVLFGCVWPIGEAAGLWLLSSKLFPFAIAWSSYPRQALDYAMTLLAWSALYFGIKNWQAWQAERERTLEAKALAHQAQLEMLRYQLNPHFLFNALNSIRASIDEDSRRAKRMITELSEFLRYSLLNGNVATVPLRDEIAAISSYLDIEKIRFEERLKVQFEIAASAAAEPIPAFLIHPLVENAIKHGMMNGAAPMQLHISAERRNNRLRLEVANTGKMQESINGTGIGLKNVRERLAQLFPDRHSFQLTETDGWIRAVIEIETPGT